MMYDVYVIHMMYDWNYFCLTVTKYLLYTHTDGSTLVSHSRKLKSGNSSVKFATNNSEIHAWYDENKNRGGSHSSSVSSVVFADLGK